MSKFVGGWIPDLPDHRDRKYQFKPEVKIPDKVDLRPLCSPVEDQGDLGSCTGQAVVGALECLEIKDKVPFEDKSRLFVYYNERVLEGTTGEDSGAMLRDGIKACVKWGVCSETLWPYDVSKFSKKPTVASYKDGATHKITAYYRIKTFNDMLNCLASGYPFVFGFSVYSNFPMESKTGVVPMPRGRMEGGHAVLAVGYDKNKKLVCFRNSWGLWGDKGYGYLPFNYISNIDMADDCWQVLRQK